MIFCFRLYSSTKFRFVKSTSYRTQHLTVMHQKSTAKSDMALVISNLQEKDKIIREFYMIYEQHIRRKITMQRKNKTPHFSMYPSLFHLATQLKQLQSIYKSKRVVNTKTKTRNSELNLSEFIYTRKYTDNSAKTTYTEFASNGTNTNK